MSKINFQFKNLFKKMDQEKLQKLTDTGVKIAKVILKAGIAIGSVALLGKANEELGKYGLNIGYTADGGIDIKPTKKPEPEKPKEPVTYDTKKLHFNSSSAQERAIAEIYLAASASYSNDTKIKAARRIFTIGANGDESTQLTAIQALGRLGDSSYSNQVKDYVNNAIADLAEIEPKSEKPEEATGAADKDKNDDEGTEKKDDKEGNENE